MFEKKVEYLKEMVLRCDKELEMLERLLSKAIANKRQKAEKGLSSEISFIENKRNRIEEEIVSIMNKGEYDVLQKY